MNFISRFGNVSKSVFAMLCIGGSLVACTTQETNNTGGAGSGGTSAAGTTGSAGTTGTGGAAGYATNDGVACLPVATGGLITAFTYDADGGTMDQVHFGDDSTSLSGGEFVYPNATSTSAYKLTSDVTGSKWHITGTVGDYSGMGLFYDNCSRIDGTGYKGISFTISGTVQGGAVTFEVDTLDDTIAASWLTTHAGTAMATDPGRCIPNAAAANQYAQTDCVEPTAPVTVTATPTPVTVLWSDFKTGKPKAAPIPTDIIGIRWVLPTPTGVGTSTVATYPLDITIDDLKFVP